MKESLFIVPIVIFIIGLPLAYAQDISSGIKVNENLVLNENLIFDQIDGPSIEIIVDDVIIDCKGHHITSNSNFAVIYARDKRNITIMNCILHGKSYAAFRFSGIDGLTIKDNVASGFVIGIFLEGRYGDGLYDNNLFISNNNFRLSKDSGIRFRDHGGLTYRGVQIINNDVSGSNTGMFLKQIEDLILSENIFNDNVVGIDLGRGTYYIKDLVVNNPLDVGFRLSDISYSTFENITIMGYGGIGLFVDLQIVGNTNQHNSFNSITSNNKDIGFMIKGEFSDNTIKDSDFSESNQYAIKTLITNGNYQFRNKYLNNDLSNSGISIEFDGNEEVYLGKDNNFSNSLTGISLKRGKYNLNGFDLSSNKEKAIMVDGCFNCILENLVVSGNGGIGIHVFDSNLINENLILRNILAIGRDKGIFIERSDNVTIKNSFFENNNFCIDTLGGSNPVKNITIYDNIFSECSHGAIRTRDLHSSYIMNNKFYNNQVGVFFDHKSNFGNKVFKNLFVDNNYSVSVLNGAWNKFYHNKFINSEVAHAYSVSGNYFSEDINWVLQGNCWGGSENLDIMDINNDGYGDSGNDYPYNKNNGGFVIGSVVDYGPDMECIKIDSDKDSILDKYDKCPNTGDNKLVEERGCNCEQIKRLFFERKTNKDGIPNGNGICQALGINPEKPQGEGPIAVGFREKINKILFGEV